MDRDLTAREFGQFRDLIYRVAGIHYPPEKLALLSSRVRRRVRAVGADGYGAYLDRLAAADQAELQDFLDAVTTNESWLFRCGRHWRCFRAWVEQRRREPDLGGAGLHLWSAAAANGAEACTALIVLHQVLGDGFGGVPVRVLATDLCARALAQARRAAFPPDALAQTPPEVVEAYFRHDRERGVYEFDRALWRHVRFERHNLMDPLAAPRRFDAALVRNVMIYFDQKSRERALANVHAALRPGGLLIVGESESLAGVPHAFELREPSVFVRPAAVAPSAR